MIRVRESELLKHLAHVEKTEAELQAEYKAAKDYRDNLRLQVAALYAP